MSTNDKRLLVTWNSLLKVLNNNAVFKPTVSLLNMKIHKAFIIRDLLNETPLCRLHNKMSFSATSGVHAKLNLEVILVGLFKLKIYIQKSTICWHH